MGQAALFNRRVDTPDAGLGAYAEARAAVELLRRALECVQNGVVITTLGSDDVWPSVVFSNAAFQAISGCPAQPFLAEDRIAEQAADSANDPLLASLRESHQSEGVCSVHITRRGRDGATRLLNIRSEPLRDESGQVTHRIMIVHDNTDRANLEEAVRRNERLACIGLLAAGIAHEINNPTGSALLAAETALAVKDLPDAGDQLTACLHNIITSMDRCGRIVGTLLRYSRQEPSEKQACSINDVVEQAIDLARPYGSSHGADIRLDLDPAVPLVPMNPLEIELVVVNLIRNAIEAGNGKVTVSVDTLRTESGVRVVVRDTGHGMSSEQIAHVFDPLFTTRRHLGGSGLGMSVAYGIVQGHEGHMEVQSQEGMGTTVTIDLPAAARSLETAGNKGHNSESSNFDRRG